MAKATRSILFFAKAPNNVAIYERVLRTLVADERIKLYLSSKNDLAKPANKIFEPFDLAPAKCIHHRLAGLRRFDLYLSPDIYLLCRRAKIKVHTFHGISIKGQAFTDKVLAYDRLFLIGPYQRKRFVERGVLPEDDKRFVPVGMPKTDAYFDGSLDRSRLLASLNLDPARKTVLYAPTWRPESSLHSMGIELIESMRDAKWNFIVKLHDLAYDSTEKVDWNRTMNALECKNVVVYRGPDVTPILHSADLLISDASSVANEFTLLDRPIVFIDVPALFKKYSKTIDLSDWGQTSGEVATSVNEVRKAIERGLKSPEHRGEIRKKIAAEGFYNAGHAAEAAVSEIYKLLDLAIN